VKLLISLSLVAVFALTAWGASRVLPTHAAVHTINFTAVGAEENPPVACCGGATGSFIFDDVTRELTFTVAIHGISATEVLFAHIHRGARGVNGPIIHDISLVPFTGVTGKVTLSAADVEDLRAGNLYFNVHSVQNRGGFARAQIILPAQPQPTTQPAPITPPSTGDGGIK
jgi:hypothetical protein